MSTRFVNLLNVPSENKLIEFKNTSFFIMTQQIKVDKDLNGALASTTNPHTPKVEMLR